MLRLVFGLVALGATACNRPADATQTGRPVAPVAPAPTATGAPAFSLPDRFTALGTEPFWAARVDGDRLTYTTPEDQAGRTTIVSRQTNGRTVELRGLIGSVPLVLTVEARQCSDGMSDTVYLFTVVRRLGNDVQRGCARSD